MESLYTVDMKFCAYHKIEEPLESFRILSNGKLSSWCIEGKREYGRQKSREAYAPIKEAVAQQKKESESATHKRCSKCHIMKPIVEFPLRADRPGKRHARCKPCRSNEVRLRNQEYTEKNFDKISAYKKKYHSEHPRYNHQSGPRRRARLQGVRIEKYTREEIRLRDGDNCYFCGQYIDPTLKWPDPLSESINHNHPLSKHGPDIAKNISLAHHRCNIRAKDNHSSIFSEGWTVEPISNAWATEVVVANHYLHRRSNTSFCFGLFKGSDLVGVVIFGSPGSYRIAKSACPSEPSLVLELNRLWIDNEAPFGAASWFVSRALKQLPPRIIVSYADNGAINSITGECHTGAVYRALSFNFAGVSKASVDWRLPGSSRNVGKSTPGAQPFAVTPKYRFWTVTGSKKEKRLLKQAVAWPSLPCPITPLSQVIQ